MSDDDCRYCAEIVHGTRIKALRRLDEAEEDVKMLRFQLSECCRDLAEAEATIQAVRDVCRDPSRRMMSTAWQSGSYIEWVDLNAVLDALNGGDDE